MAPRDVVERMNGWFKPLMVALPLAGGIVFGYGKLSAKVEDDRSAMVRELDLIHHQLDRIEAYQIKLLSTPASRR